MQFRLISGFLIFIGSYFPLTVILAVQDIPAAWWAQDLCTKATFKAGHCAFMPFEHPALTLSFSVVALLAVVLTWSSLRKLTFRFTIQINQAKAVPNELINYTFPYVVSFMGISYGESQKLLGFLVFLLWMFAITYKSGQILMNPLLIVFGWQLHEATIVINGTEEREVRVLTRGQLVPGRQRAEKIQDFYITKT
ncbi:hypothetical protein PTKU64_94270 (plasmid) [Paraburkholderia terrae]|uniref:Uncharacterized protein n=1 Tax=Paraburkholderia terrae TaxID=311230 RepID=A0ABM7U347_9BURK|nr:hypothetical protein [Paraburkholderia terrae]BCZ85752.1 hypothetical protein PTKU64_94270 [Paraburkholderia terrae]